MKRIRNSNENAKEPNEISYENQNEIAQGIIWKTIMKLSDKKMKVVWNWNEIVNEISGHLYEMHLWYSPTTYEWSPAFEWMRDIGNWNERPFIIMLEL